MQVYTGFGRGQSQRLDAGQSGGERIAKGVTEPRVSVGHATVGGREGAKEARGLIRFGAVSRDQVQPDLLRDLAGITQINTVVGCGRQKREGVRVVQPFTLLYGADLKIGGVAHGVR